jgi:Flp pilus assembly protein CpaB
MKRSVILLIVLGTVAATATTVLVNSLRASGQQTVAQDVEVNRATTIVVAAQDLPKGTILSRRMVETQQIQPRDMPEGSVGDLQQAVRRVLAKPIKKGEPLLTVMFAQELIEALPKGKVLMGVPVDRSSASLSLGCKVNVMWTSKPKSGNKAESKALMGGISVWGIGDRTIVAPDGAERQAGSSGRDPKVTLLLDLNQAQQIGVAMQSGTIWLTPRSQEDTWTAPVTVPATPEPSTPQEPSPKKPDRYQVHYWSGE